MIEHDYFGVVEPEQDEAWFEQVEANDQLVDVRLIATNAVTEEQLDRAAAMLIALEAIDLHAREAFVSELSSTGSNATKFTLAVTERLGEEILADTFERTSGDYAIEILRSMAFESLTINPEFDEEGESFATARFVFRPEETSLELVLTLDATAEPVASQLESFLDD